MSGDRKIRVGSRKSELALIQTNHVIGLLKEANPGMEFEIVTMNTLGDKVLDKPLPKIGEKSLFTKELETALTNGHVDFVVHSLKDLPTTLPEGMVVGAVLEREDPRDALVLQRDLKDMTLETLPKGSVIGTSSLRRSAQLARKHPHIKVENIRGNLNTRLKKLDELGKYQAIILAVAGLNRMGWQSRVTKVLNCHELLYAVGQGALAVECRENDIDTIKLLQPLHDAKTVIRVIAERTFLQTLGGGCSAPVAVSTKITNLQPMAQKLTITGAVWSLDGQDEIMHTVNKELKFERNSPIKKCASCPYQSMPDGCVNIENCEKPYKKLKTDSGIPIDLLKNDVHDQCPVALPVGADFMGKCPYLENTQDLRHPPVDVEKSDGSLDVSKCPFFNDKRILENSIPGSSKTSSNEQLYCGIVPHFKLPLDVLEDARALGLNLAKELIAKGALDVMSKAQALVRSS